MAIVASPIQNCGNRWRDLGVRLKRAGLINRRVGAGRPYELEPREDNRDYDYSPLENFDDCQAHSFFRTPALTLN